ncbi:MAG: hypothetical protein HFE94_05345 [Acutalibacter sp.]|nr:hypothetical protein [Acutalibacter sp.]
MRRENEGAIVGLFDYRGKFHHTAHCPDNDFVLQYTSQYLDNRIEQFDGMPDQEDSDMAKINRAVTINGEKRWIRANTEQEYIDKAAKLLGANSQQEQDKPKHPFREYANNWFEV